MSPDVLVEAPSAINPDCPPRPNFPELFDWKRASPFLTNKSPLRV